MWIGLEMRASKFTISAYTNTESIRWYAAYTSANHEKRVGQQMVRRSIEHFLPIYRSLRRWKDRRIELELPLFPGYVFVRLAIRDRLQVLKIPGVVRLVGFNGLPAPLPENEIDGLRRAQMQGMTLEPHKTLTIGRRVRIVTGPLAGHEGILKQWKGNLRVVLTVAVIQRSISVEVDGTCLEPVRYSAGSGLVGDARSHYLQIAS